MVCELPAGKGKARQGAGEDTHRALGGIIVQWHVKFWKQSFSLHPLPKKGLSEGQKFCIVLQLANMNIFLEKAHFLLNGWSSA